MTRSYATIKVEYMTAQYNGFGPSYRCCEYVAQYIANGPWWYVNAPQFHYRAFFFPFKCIRVRHPTSHYTNTLRTLRSKVNNLLRLAHAARQLQVSQAQTVPKGGEYLSAKRWGLARGERGNYKQ